MLYDVEFQAWCNNLRLSQQQRDLVNQIRTSPPARKVQGGGRNVHGSYASSKMGRTIQFKSHTVELPAITQFYEYDDQVLEYWDQPIKFSIKCSPQGKQATTIGHYPDFFVMRKDCCGFEEWKTEKRLEKLSEEQPYRYQKIERQWAKVLNVKKNPIKTAQNMLIFGRKIKVYLFDSDYKFISQDCQRYLERTAKKRLSSIKQSSIL